MSDRTSRNLCSVLESDQSHVLRVLIADLVRELLHNGTERSIFKSSPGSLKIIDEFPFAKEADPVWMGRVIEHLSGNDVGRAFSEPYGRSIETSKALINGEQD